MSGVQPAMERRKRIIVQVRPGEKCACVKCHGLGVQARTVSKEFGGAKNLGYNCRKWCVPVCLFFFFLDILLMAEGLCLVHVTQCCGEGLFPHRQNRWGMSQDDMFVWCCRDSMGAVLCMSSIYCKTRPISVHSWKECACLLVKRRQCVGNVRVADGVIYLSLQVASTIITRLSIIFRQSHHDSYFKGCQLRIDTPPCSFDEQLSVLQPSKINATRWEHFVPQTQFRRKRPTINDEIFLPTV